VVGKYALKSVIGLIVFTFAGAKVRKKTQTCKREGIFLVRSRDKRVEIRE
jgi:hypothetical protein